MNKQLERIKKTRLYLLDLIKDLSVEQLNETPPGFTNNIIWNLGHLVAAQQGICYARPGLPIVTEEKYFTPFKPGSKPEGTIDADEIDTIKQLLFSTLEQLEADYGNNTFANYTTWTTRYGIDISSIDDAVDFLLFHEGYHSGYILALKRLVSR